MSNIVACCMLRVQNLNLELWAEVVVNAVYTSNRCLTSAVPNMTPDQAWSGRQPCIAHMRTFGCIVFAKVPNSRRTKLEAKATKCLFLGYCEGTKTYRLMSVETKKIIRSRDVTFCEESSNDVDLHDGPSGRSQDEVVIVDKSSKSPIVDVSDEDEGEDDDHLDVDAANELLKSKKVTEKGQQPQPGMVTEDQIASDRHYPDRVRKPLGEWWKNHILPQSEDEHANVALLDGPSTICEAMQCEDANKWEQAMDEDYKSLMANGVGD